jgi:hypothetical protein
MNTINHERIITTLWFAIAGFIPAVILFRSFSFFTVESYVLYLGFPVLCAGVSGYSIGYPILHATTTGKQTALRILSIALISCVALVVAMAVRLEFTFDFNFAQVFVIALLLLPVLFLGQFAILLLSGILAGWLLFVYKANLKKLLLVGSPLIILMGGWILWSLPDPNALPIYPNAENVQYEESTGSAGLNVIKVISFQTRDSFEDVLHYYESELINEGWQYSSRSDNFLRVHSPGKKYSLRVEKYNTGQIQIELQYSVIP